MRETPAGLLFASVDEDRCTGCGVCVACCPGPGFRVPVSPGIDAFAGPVGQAFAGHAGSDEVRRSGQSGGIVGALLAHLLESGEVTGALAVEMPADGSLRPVVRILRDAKGLAATQGSKYCPVPAVSALRALAPAERIVVVGLPCHIHGIRRMLDAGRVPSSAVHSTIGLVCDRVLAYSAIDRMARDLGVDTAEAAGFEYRSKARTGWPGEVCFTMRSGARAYGSQELRRGLKQYATPPRCRVCFDKMNTMSDVAVGDAWEVAESPVGSSVVLARTEAGERMLLAAQRAGAVSLAELGADAVFASAGLEPLRRRFSAFREAHAAAGLPVPEFEGIGDDLATPDRAERRLARQLTRIDAWVAASASREQAVTRIGLARALHGTLASVQHLAVRVARRMGRAPAGSEPATPAIRRSRLRRRDCPPR
jgi:coenzyme F420 hydrogenase subunit beta